MLRVHVPMMYLALLSLLAVVTLTSSNVLYFKPHDLGGVKCPDGESECPTGNTCCKEKSGNYGCCPVPDANCCSDGVHCCPANQKCDLVHKKCISPGVNVPLLQKVPAKLKVKNMIRMTDSVYEAGMSDSPKDSVKHIQWNKLMKSWKKYPGHVMCPDKESECGDGDTCCKNPHGKYGCCQLTDAVCCDDGLHCCPQGYTCDLEKGDCEKVNLKNMVVKKEKNVPCPGGDISCKDGETCCQTERGYGCCPTPHAVCCSDKKHCCPEGYTCETGKGTCKKGSSIVEWLTKTEPVKKESIVCPGGKQTCTSKQTCCQVGSGYGCCPVAHAVCCSDKKHCCPEGYTCETGKGTCKKGNSVIEWLTKIEPVKKESIVCPGGKQTCTSKQTCCQVGSGYGCCPVAHAVCCSDKKHCCPEGYTCETGKGTCKKGNSVVEWLTKIEPVKKESIVCPGGKQTCTSKQTCCQVGSGYGCCPVPHAVCCSDKKHCCPEGYTCETGKGTCKKGNSVIEWLTKIEPVKKESIVCPGGKQTCTSKQTCCQVGSGYGCCPVPHAVCCSDKKHCCPEGYTCETGKGTCKKGNSVVEWLTKIEPVKKESIVCPGGKQTCTSKQTCCQVGSGYGCCPVPHAVCCSDKKHCCPEGYTCETGKGTCKKGNSVIEWLTKIEPVKKESITCPGGKQTCTSKQTCCQVGSGYGCCPVPHAACCSDEKHCCPHGYTCNTGSGTCTKGNSVVEWLTKIEPVKKESVTCPGGKRNCTSTETCCPTGSGYGCCPLLHAVCCSDKKHCCPTGYKCDATGGRCIRGNQVNDWLPKIEIVKPEPHTTDNCCANSTCCPFKGAHCCKNGSYCCPKDYRCDTQPFCCIDPDGKSKKRGIYYNMMLKKMAKKISIKLIDFK